MIMIYHSYYRAQIIASVAYDKKTSDFNWNTN